MGVEFNLCNLTTRRYLRLYKATEHGFQIPAEAIAAFLREHCWNSQLQLVHDVEPGPHEEGNFRTKPDWKEWTGPEEDT